LGWSDVGQPADLLLYGVGEGVGALGHFGGALEFFPVERLAVDGALDGSEEDEGEELAVGEALQPDVEEEPAIALVGWMAAFEREGDRGGNEVNDEEAEEVEDELFEVGGGGGFGVKVAVNEVVVMPARNMKSMKGESSGKSIWKMRILGRAK